MSTILRRGAAAAAITASLAGLGALFGATSADAAGGNVVQWRNQVTQACLSGLPTIHRVYGSPCNNPSNNIAYWSVHRWRDGTREFQVVNDRFAPNGYCLDDSNEGLRTYPCNATPFQSWYLDRNRDGSTKLRNQATGRVVQDDAFAGPQPAKPSASPFQNWY